MARKPKFKKADAQREAGRIVAEIAAAFNVPAPAVKNRKDEFPEWGNPWEFITEESKVWTLYGAARLSVSISPTFAHMFFRFDDPKRAAEALGRGRLNHASGKWNSWAGPPVGLAAWVEELKADFARVAQPEPDPAEVEAHEAKERAALEQWQSYISEMERERAAGLGKIGAELDKLGGEG